MTEGEWITIGLAGIGFLIQGATALVMRTRDLEQIKQSIDKKISTEKLARTEALNNAVRERDEELEKIVKEWNANQRAQDSAVGEMGLALRRFIEGVEKEMHKIEIWGRDNYVQKPELESVRNDIKVLGADMKHLISDMKKDLKEDIQDLKGKSPAHH
jgi:hypothetical protein